PGAERDPSGILRAIRVSALTGAGIAELRTVLALRFPAHDALPDADAAALADASRASVVATRPLPTTLPMSLNDPQWGKRGNSGPPDLDEIWRNASRRLNEILGRRAPGSTDGGGGGGNGGRG